MLPAPFAPNAHSWDALLRCKHCGFILVVSTDDCLEQQLEAREHMPHRCPPVCSKIDLPRPKRTERLYQCSACDWIAYVTAETHRPRGCDRTNCTGTQHPTHP